MARFFAAGSKGYRLDEGVFTEIGDTIGDGIGTASVFINDGETDATFEAGDVFPSGETYLGSLTVPLSTGGSIALPVLQGNLPSSVVVQTHVNPFNGPYLWSETLDINALDKSPFQALFGPTTGDDRFRGIEDRELDFLLAGDDVFRAAGGNDLIRGNEGNDRIFGQAGDDSLFGDEGRDKLVGGTGNDRLEGGANRDRLIGGSGNDTLEGDEGRDRLDGGGGDDDLTGGTGNDRLRGGNGADDFNFFASGGIRLGRDVIEDFNSAEDDTIWLFVEDVDAVTFTTRGGDTIIDHEGGRIVLKDVITTADDPEIFII